ncbi:MAG: RecX family transcriptional regulator [Sphingobacteriales bacterium]|nr:MAG: RecX family transcriptional regulator [Sphingobacteriales bacterium]
MEKLAAIVHYCQYQERCHKEVRNKLYELGCYREEVEELLSKVIEQGLLNEERYARAIARGKFKMLHWGKVKIVQALKFDQVSDYCIKKALTEIDENEYEATGRRLLEKKWAELRGEKNIFIKKKKAYNYLLQKGYDAKLVHIFIEDLNRD